MGASAVFTTGDFRDTFSVSAVFSDVASAASRSRLVAIAVNRMRFSDQCLM
jgi:hypothetical protein